MYSKILVAVDGSDTSQHALKQAIELASKLSAKLRIVHVVDMSWLPIGPELAIDTSAISAARHSAGENIVAAAREAAQMAGFETETALIETATPTQHVAEVIAQEASRWPADLVVLGTHGRRGLQRLISGSVAEHMTRLSPEPVLLVPSPKGSKPAQ
jgi:nucleotide-binding universal stress UspA family protein